MKTKINQKFANIDGRSYTYEQKYNEYDLFERIFLSFRFTLIFLGIGLMFSIFPTFTTMGILIFAIVFLVLTFRSRKR
jgi:hypothetical protein